MAVIPSAQPQPLWISEQTGRQCERPEKPPGACVGWIVHLAAPLWTAVTIHVDLPLDTVKMLRM